MMYDGFWSTMLNAKYKSIIFHTLFFVFFCNLKMHSFTQCIPLNSIAVVWCLHSKGIYKNNDQLAWQIWLHLYGNNTIYRRTKKPIAGISPKYIYIHINRLWVDPLVWQILNFERLHFRSVELFCICRTDKTVRSAKCDNSLPWLRLPSNGVLIITQF